MSAVAGDHGRLARYLETSTRLRAIGGGAPAQPRRLVAATRYERSAVATSSGSRSSRASVRPLRRIDVFAGKPMVDGFRDAAEIILAPMEAPDAELRNSFERVVALREQQADNWMQVSSTSGIRRFLLVAWLGERAAAGKVSPPSRWPTKVPGLLSRRR
jgi:hypothetical protein